ncbi:phosphatase 2C-like domain-containing protein [Lipomyces arxii]|uniref:phosphatase 2C-like domain-containing protein n=1 Tax=Lipomyces arxii TaxID=56418 RepID=UPI0034CD96DE
MGQLLSEPVVEKSSDHDADERFCYGTSSMQGWRVSMEDAHTCVLDLKREDGKSAPDKQISFFAVYDGHGGSKAAIFAGQQLHKIVARQAAYEKGDYEQALKDGFLSTDRAILQDPNFGNDPSGCTATTILISDTTIFAANAGDSRTVLGVKGQAKPLSYDHKPTNEGERARIEAAGGFVDSGRVNGNLALSRAIGDFDFKKSPDLPPEEQVVTAFPDVLEHEIGPDDEFVVLACDGIWDCLSSQAVVEFVRRGIAEKQPLALICENLMDNCLAPTSDLTGVGCDNMTVTIVGILQGQTPEEWYETIATRVENGEGAVADRELGKRYRDCVAR